MLSKKSSNREIEEYRNLMETPTEFEEGFTSKTILGVLFVADVGIDEMRVATTCLD